MSTYSVILADDKYIIVHNNQSLYINSNPITTIYRLLTLEPTHITTTNILIYHALINLTINEPINYDLTSDDRKTLRQCVYQLRNIALPTITLV